MSTATVGNAAGPVAEAFVPPGRDAGDHPAAAFHPQRLFRVLDPEVTRPVVAELAWLGRQLGEENDTHAMIEELHRLFSALPRESAACHVAADVERELGQRSGACTTKASGYRSAATTTGHSTDDLSAPELRHGAF
jgi:CHAD domain-containing protein